MPEEHQNEEKKILDTVFLTERPHNFVAGPRVLLLQQQVSSGKQRAVETFNDSLDYPTKCPVYLVTDTLPSDSATFILIAKGPTSTPATLWGPLFSKVNDFSQRGTYIPIFPSHLQVRDNSKHTYVRNWEFKETLHSLTHVHTFPPSSATPNLGVPEMIWVSVSYLVI